MPCCDCVLDSTSVALIFDNHALFCLESCYLKDGKPPIKPYVSGWVLELRNIRKFVRTVFMWTKAMCELGCEVDGWLLEWLRWYRYFGWQIKICVRHARKNWFDKVVGSVDKAFEGHDMRVFHKGVNRLIPGSTSPCQALKVDGRFITLHRNIGSTKTIFHESHGWKEGATW